MVWKLFTKTYPHAQLQDFPRRKPTWKNIWEAKKSLAAGAEWWGTSFWLLLNGYLVLQGNIPFRTAQSFVRKHPKQLLARNKLVTRYPLG